MVLLLQICKKIMNINTLYIMHSLDNPAPEYFMYIVCILIKNGCYSIPTTARIKAIKVSVKT